MEKPSSVTKSPKLKQLTSPVPPPPLPPLPDKPAVGLVAKSPPEATKGGTLQSRGSEEEGVQVRRDPDAMRVLTYGSLQLLSGLLMAVFGVLTLLHHSAMAQYGAGLWGGGCGAAAGLAGLLAGLRGYHHPGESPGQTALTVYLALSLVSVAVTTLALVLTSIGLLRDLNQPSIYFTEDDTGVAVVSEYAAVLSSGGLALVCALLLVSLVVAVCRLYRLVCPCTRPRAPPHRRLDSPSHSHASTHSHKVHSWLGHQHTPPPLLYPATPTSQPGLLVYPPPLLVENGGPGLYTVPPSSLGVSMGYPPCISPMYMQRRRSPHHHSYTPRGRLSVTPDSTKRSRRQEREKESVRPERETTKEKEITDEQLERTYTGLDREIAEEFISIAMTNSGPRGTKKASHQSSREDRVIDCIAPM